MLLYQTYHNMSKFTLFKQALQEYEKTKVTNGVSVVNSLSEEESSGSSCFHDNVITEKGSTVCVDCGEEVPCRQPQSKYTQNDSKHVSDPNRVQIRKNEERSIFKDVENLGFSENIIARANKIYAEVTKGKICRGNSRRAIIFACIFHAYKISGKPQTHDRLIKIFDLKRKTCLQGLKYVNLYAPKNSAIRTTYITPINLVDEIMDQFCATKEQKQEVIELYEQIRNKSSRLNRSRPGSVAAGIVYYWICLRKKDISLKEFTEKVTLSELTVNKIAKEIAEVLDTPDIV